MTFDYRFFWLLSCDIWPI